MSNMRKKNLKVFNELCSKAKEMVFDAISSDNTYQFLYVDELDESLLDMSPIEQIFQIAYQIYSLRAYKDIGIELMPQQYIKANNNVYRVHFLLVYACDKDGSEKKLKKPLVIETDGKNWHSSKKQMNHDYERENDLKLAGYDVMRFTGSQVYNKPFDCISSVFDYVMNNCEV